MDHAGAVRRLQGVRDAGRDGQRLVEGNRPPGDPLLEGGAVDELQHQGARAAVLLQAVNLGDARMVERREQLRLALEPGQAIRVGGEGVG